MHRLWHRLRVYIFTEMYMLLKIVSFGMRYSAVSFPYLSTTILLCFIATEEKPKINCQVVIEQLPASCGDASLPSNQPTYAIGTIIVPTDTSLLHGHLSGR